MDSGKILSISGQLLGYSELLKVKTHQKSNNAVKSLICEHRNRLDFKYA